MGASNKAGGFSAVAQGTLGAYFILSAASPPPHPASAFPSLIYYISISQSCSPANLSPHSSILRGGRPTEFSSLSPKVKVLNFTVPKILLSNLPKPGRVWGKAQESAFLTSVQGAPHPSRFVCKPDSPGGQRPTGSHWLFTLAVQKAARPTAGTGSLFDDPWSSRVCVIKFTSLHLTPRLPSDGFLSRNHTVQ